MAEMNEIPPGPMYFLPPEILQNIFIYLPGKDLIRCRAVSPVWKVIIDRLSTDHSLWHRNCKKDFQNVFIVARKKAKPGLHWYNLYRSLSLWRLLLESTEERDDFATATRSAQEIRNFEILKDGILGVLQEGSIVYYDIETLAASHREPITGDYSQYTETDSVIVILSYIQHLFILRKLIRKINEDSSVTFNNIKLFTLSGQDLYFVNMNDDIFVCNLRSRRLTANFMAKTEDGVLSIGFGGGYLNVLTFKGEVLSIVGDHIVKRCALGLDSNLPHQLQKFNFLQHLDWRVYFQCMYVLKHTFPDRPLRDIIIIRPYGDVYFVGSNWGVLRIYYAPYSAGELNIFSSKPIKQYDFLEPSEGGVRFMCPILQVDVMEGNDGHMVIVAMPKKIVVLNFSHNFETETYDPRVINSQLPDSSKECKVLPLK